MTATQCQIPVYVIYRKLNCICRLIIRGISCLGGRKIRIAAFIINISVKDPNRLCNPMQKYEKTFQGFWKAFLVLMRILCVDLLTESIISSFCQSFMGIFRGGTSQKYLVFILVLRLKTVVWNLIFALFPASKCFCANTNAKVELP